MGNFIKMEKIMKNIVNSDNIVTNLRISGFKFPGRSASHKVIFYLYIVCFVYQGTCHCFIKSILI